MVDGAYVELWLVAFAVTLAIEVPLYVLLLGQRIPSVGKRVFIGVGVNVVTHPLVWFVAAQAFWFKPYWAWLLVTELGVVFVEGLLLAMALGFLPHKAAAIRVGLLLAFIPNLISTLVGLAIHG